MGRAGEPARHTALSRRGGRAGSDRRLPGRGRVESDGAGPALAAALQRKAEWHGGETEVREVLVMSSELTPQGPVYAVLSRAKLRHPAGGRAPAGQEEE